MPPGAQPTLRAPLRPSWRGAAGWLLGSAALALAFGLLTWTVLPVADGADPWDERLATQLHEAALAHPWLVDAALVLDVVGGGAFCTLVTAVVALGLLLAVAWRRAWGLRGYAVLLLVACALGGSALNRTLKQTVQRPRPPWNGLWLHEGSWSYPSGHAQAGVTVWIVLAGVAFVLLGGRSRWLVSVPLAALGVVIGVSRALLGVHWPSDVLGGWLSGAALASTCAALLILVVVALDRRRTEEPATLPSSAA